MEKTKSERPLWSYQRPAYTSNRGYYQTEYGARLGTYGHNPRSKLNAESTTHKTDDDELHMGSTKMTAQVPGYCGFLPKADYNPHALTQGKGDAPRQTFIK